MKYIYVLIFVSSQASTAIKSFSDFRNIFIVSFFLLCFSLFANHCNFKVKIWKHFPISFASSEILLVAYSLSNLDLLNSFQKCNEYIMRDNTRF